MCDRGTFFRCIQIAHEGTVIDQFCNLEPGIENQIILVKNSSLLLIWHNMCWNTLNTEKPYYFLENNEECYRPWLVECDKLPTNLLDDECFMDGDKLFDCATGNLWSRQQDCIVLECNLIRPKGVTGLQGPTGPAGQGNWAEQGIQDQPDPKDLQDQQEQHLSCA